MKSILDNWVAFLKVWDESLDKNLEPEIKCRIIGVKKQMNSGNLSKTLQKYSLTSCQGKEIADLTLKTINSLRSKSEFELLRQKTLQQAEVLEITQASL